MGSERLPLGARADPRSHARLDHGFHLVLFTGAAMYFMAFG